MLREPDVEYGSAPTCETGTPRQPLEAADDPIAVGHQEALAEDRIRGRLASALHDNYTTSTDNTWRVSPWVAMEKLDGFLDGWLATAPDNPPPVIPKWAYKVLVCVTVLGLLLLAGAALECSTMQFNDGGVPSPFWGLCNPGVTDLDGWTNHRPDNPDA